jgi:hypothetical protein
MDVLGQLVPNNGQTLDFAGCKIQLFFVLTQAGADSLSDEWWELNRADKSSGSLQMPVESDADGRFQVNLPDSLFSGQNRFDSNLLDHVEAVALNPSETQQIGQINLSFKDLDKKRGILIPIEVDSILRPSLDSLQKLLVISGRLTFADGSLSNVSNCKVDVIFFLKEPAAKAWKMEMSGEAQAAVARTSYLAAAPCSADGKFLVQCPKALLKVDINIDEILGTLDRLEAKAKNASGRVIGEGTFEPKSAFAEGITITIEPESVGTIDLADLHVSKDTADRRIRGRVIDVYGGRIAAGTQVILSGREQGKTPNEKMPTVPLLVARTDSSGYFSGSVRHVKLASIEAIIAGFDDVEGADLKDGYLPSHLILAVKQHDMGAPLSDCDCSGEQLARTPTHEDFDVSPGSFTADLGTGGCIQFNVPNRSLEEFDFYSVVRTTEPGILGFDFQEPPLQSVVASDPALDPRVLDAKNIRDLALVELERLQTVSVTNSGSDDLNKVWKLYNTVFNPYQTNSSYGYALGSLQSIVETKALTTSVWDQETAEVTLFDLIKGFDSDQISLRKIAKDWIGAVSGITSANLTQNSDGYSAASDIFENKKRIAQSRANTALNGGATATADIGKAQAKMDLADAAYKRALATAKSERAAQAAKTDFDAKRQGARPPGRNELGAENAVDWDDTPTFYQSAQVAHGHLLQYKQTWYADGYSLGDLLYSLPLAPGQKKLISVAEWERREESTRRENTMFGESLDATLSRDRDLSEVVRGALTESSRGGSKATTAGVGGGLGLAANGSYQGVNFGGLLGVSAGYGEGTSSAWQDSAKNISSGSLQNLRDRTMQSASALRSLRSTVINIASQGEAVRATTEVVANHNHCHAVTMQYFEVLRHFKLEQELVGAQECLFVPLPMSAFDIDKALRWREELSAYIKLGKFSGTFDAARRIATQWEDSDSPPNEYGGEHIVSVSGELLITITMPAPPFPQKPKPDPAVTAEETAREVAKSLLPTEGFLGIGLAILTGGASLIAGAATNAAINAGAAAAKGAKALAQELNELDPQERYAKFHHEIVPGIVEAFINTLRLSAKVNGQPQPIGDVDFTLVSQYQPGRPLEVSLSANLGGRWPRNAITELMVSSDQALPIGAKAILNTANLRYRTRSFEHALIVNGRVNDDIEVPIVSSSIVIEKVKLPPLQLEVEVEKLVLNPVSQGGKATLYTPIDAWEQRSPRKEDRRLVNELISHLNDNLEYYHHAIWWAMDPNRRYLLLDGFTSEHSAGNSLASIVENRLIGIVGNSLVMPVAPGYNLDPKFKAKSEEGKAVDLLEHYKPTQRIPSTHITLPTRGVFAEAVMGNCNSCETIDDSKFWRWEQSPIDEPPGIEALSMSSRRADPISGAPTNMPAPLVSIQNAPGVPDPAGVAGVLSQLGHQTFADITGLAGNQSNAAAAYKQALDTAFKFAKEASVLAQQASVTKSLDRTMNAIDKAEASGGISPESAKELRTDALRQMVGSPSSSSSTTQNQPTAASSKLAEASADAVRGGGAVTATQTFPDGTSASVSQALPDAGTTTSLNYSVESVQDITPFGQNDQTGDNTCWAAVAAMMTAWKNKRTNSSVKTELEFMGEPYRILYANNGRLPEAQKFQLLTQLEMTVDRSVKLVSGQPRDFDGLLRSYGPLWATFDSDHSSSGVKPHAKLIYGVIGDGTPSGTKLMIVDPRSGTKSQQIFDQFTAEMEELLKAGAAAGGTTAGVVRFRASTGGEGDGGRNASIDLSRLVTQVSMSLGNLRDVTLKMVPKLVSPLAPSRSWEHGASSPSFPTGWVGTTMVDATGLRTADLKHDLEMTHPGTSTPMTMKMTVLDSMRWSNAKMTQRGGTQADLPLTREFLIAEHSGHALLDHGKTVFFPLPAKIECYLTLVFGWVITSTGGVTRLDLEQSNNKDLHSWLDNGGSGNSGDTVVLGVYDLSLNKPLDDYQPKPLGLEIFPGIADVARLYPLLSFWSSKACESIEAELEIVRPTNSSMPGMWNAGTMAGGMFADHNGKQKTFGDEFRENRPILSTTALASAGVLLAPLEFAPSVRWDALFANYQFPAQTNSPILVVDRFSPASGTSARPDGHSKRWDIATASYVPRAPIRKVARQKAFDNIHIAPAMDYLGAIAVMAPVCHHDCFHMHWRWTDAATDAPVSGWDGGLPYTKAGAAMIPVNQELAVAATGSSFNYIPNAVDVPAKEWQIFCHHGAGYLTKVNRGGNAMLIIEGLTGQAGDSSWEAFYYHNRYQETGGLDRTKDVERLDVSLFSALESM